MAVPTLPKRISLEDVSNYLVNISKVPIGLVKKDLSAYTYDFVKNFMTIISAKNIDFAIEFSKYLIEEIKNLKNIKIEILNADTVGKKMKKVYSDFIKSIKNDIKTNNDIFTICVIIGIDKFTSEEIIDEYEFSELLSEAKETALN